MKLNNKVNLKLFKNNSSNPNRKNPLKLKNKKKNFNTQNKINKLIINNSIHSGSNLVL